jgi:hypothetical protein
MGDKDWISAAIQAQSQVITLWTVYVGIAAAVLAFVAARREELRRPGIRIGTIAAYLAVSSVNLWAILNARKEHDLMVSFIWSPALDALKACMLRPRPMTYVVMHLGVDLMVVLIVWLVPQKGLAGGRR